ncbi:MAG: hypothetical protein ABI162_06250 [Luteolibacter sp.]
MSFFDDAIATVGRGLAQTAVQAVSDATGYNVGGTLNVLFGNGQTTGGETLANIQTDLPQNWTGPTEQLTVLENGITQQTQMISDLGIQLSAIAVAVDAISGEIQDLQEMMTKIGQAQLYQTWQTIDASITSYIAAVQTSYEAYGEYISTFSQIETSLVVELTTDILNTNNGPRVAVNAINTYILGGDQAKGVLQLWSEMVAGAVTAGLLDYRDAVNQYIAYYQKLVYTQLTATNLVMEAYTFLNEHEEAKTVWKRYRDVLLTQEDPFITWLVPLVAAGTALPQAAKRFYTFTNNLAALDLDPSLQRTSPGTKDINAYYEPSAIFKRAESLLANLYVTGPLDRRIVVHMLYSSVAEVSSLVSGVSLTLSSTDGETVVPAATATNLPQTYAYPTCIDYNISYGGAFLIKRFVFKADAISAALADDSYQITNINNTDGLISLQTYLSVTGGNAPAVFMNPNVLAYTLSVNDAEPFDFMNFVVYMIPISSAGSNQ